MAPLRTVSFILIVFTLATGCRAMTGKSAGTTLDDATITASVKSRLVADKASNLTRVDVDTNSGIVSLNGTVETLEQKTRAEQLAKEAPDVKQVINNLQLQKR